MSAVPAGPARRGRSLRLTLVALLLVTVAAMCAAVALVTHVSVHDQLSAQLDQQLARLSERSAHQVSDPDDAARAPAGRAPQGRGDIGGGEFELTAVLSGGRLEQATWRDRDGDLERLTARDRERLTATAAHADDGRGADVDLSVGAYRVVAAPAPDGSTVLVGLPRGPMHETLERLDLTLAVASLGALLVTGISGSLIVRRTMRPLEQVSRIASEVAAMELDSGEVTLAERAAAAPAGTEVGEVSRALNHLLDNVEGALEARQASEERMRRFVADASHELRTPLTSIRGYAQLLRLTERLSPQGAASLDRLDVQSLRMSGLVDDLLLLARLDEGAAPESEELDFGEIVVESVLDARVMGPEHRWLLSAPDEPVTVRGDARQLAQVLANLLSNARKHTPGGTAVQVRLAAHEGRAVLEVADDGPGIPGELLGSVFDRFARADAARSGSEPTTGLGLPIVEAIVRAHGGEISVDSESGATRFTVRLPLVGAPSAPSPSAS